MDNVIVRLEAAADHPLIFVLYTLLFFALMALVIAVVTYFIMCRLNKKTTMVGIMRVGVVLNQVGIDQKNGKVDASVDSDYAKLDFGEYLVGMEDSGDKYLLNPPLSWQQKAAVRRYPVEAFLGRFYMAFAGAGFGDNDPASVMLKALLWDDIFCAELGKVSRRSGKHGLSGSGVAVYEPDSKDSDKLAIYAKLPASIGEVFQKETGCEVQTIGIIIEYTDSLKSDEL